MEIICAKSQLEFGTLGKKSKTERKIAPPCELGAVPHACYPIYLGDRDREDCGLRYGQKLARPHLNQ
jgi:hypothetical protein